MQPTLFGVAILPAIVGVVEVAKQAGVPSRLAPLVSLLLGILSGVALQYTAVAHPVLSGPVVVAGIAIGISLGLAAVGLYSAVDHFSNPPPDSHAQVYVATGTISRSDTAPSDPVVSPAPVPPPDPVA